MSRCRHPESAVGGEPGDQVSRCRSCGIELNRTDRAVWDFVSRSGPTAAQHITARIEAAKAGYGRRKRG